MDNKKLLEILANLRRINYSLWEQYHEEAKDEPGWRDGMRDMYEMDVRALDYVMEAIRHDAI